MEKTDKRQRKLKKFIWLIPIVMLLLSIFVFLVYINQYYHADESALEALKSDNAVYVVKTDYGWLFDGPSETDAIIFYPGGKVDETAYAPLLHGLAEQGMDVCLVQMPFRLAIFGKNKADQVIAQYEYDRWYIGGHSLGGVMAADYTAEHSSVISGVIMLAAYPIRPLDENLRCVIIYGSEDGILDMERLERANRYLPDNSEKTVIEGGNHAQFGNYGNQSNDGIATISSEEQQNRTIEIIMQNK